MDNSSSGFHFLPFKLQNGTIQAKYESGKAISKGIFKMKYLAIILIFASCRVIEPTLQPIGTVVQVRDGKALVVFTQVSGQEVGSAWFKLDSAYLGQQIRLR